MISRMRILRRVFKDREAWKISITPISLTKVSEFVFTCIAVTHR